MDTESVANLVAGRPTLYPTKYDISQSLDEFVNTYRSDSPTPPMRDMKPNLPSPVDMYMVGSVSSFVLPKQESEYSDEQRRAIDENISYAHSRWIAQYFSGGMEPGDEGMAPIFLDMNAHDVGRNRGWDGVTFAKESTLETRNGLPGVQNMAFIKLVASDKHRGLRGKAIPAGVIPVRLLMQSLDEAFALGGDYSLYEANIIQELVNKMLLQHPVLRHDRNLKDVVFACTIPIGGYINTNLIRVKLNDLGISENVFDRVPDVINTFDENTSPTSGGNVKRARHEDMVYFASSGPLDHTPFSPVLINPNETDVDDSRDTTEIQQAITIAKDIKDAYKSLKKGDLENGLVEFSLKAISVYKYRDGLYDVIPLTHSSFKLIDMDNPPGRYGSETMSVIVECCSKAFILWHIEAEHSRNFGIRSKSIAPRIVAMPINYDDMLEKKKPVHALKGWIRTIKKSLKSPPVSDPQFTHADFATWLPASIVDSKLVTSAEPNANWDYAYERRDEIYGSKDKDEDEDENEGEKSASASNQYAGGNFSRGNTKAGVSSSAAKTTSQQTAPTNAMGTSTQERRTSGSQRNSNQGSEGIGRGPNNTMLTDGEDMGNRDGSVEDSVLSGFMGSIRK